MPSNRPTLLWLSMHCAIPAGLASRDSTSFAIELLNRNKINRNYDESFCEIYFNFHGRDIWGGCLMDFQWFSAAIKSNKKQLKSDVKNNEKLFLCENFWAFTFLPPFKLCRKLSEQFSCFDFHVFRFTISYSHWLGVPETRSVVVSRTVIVTCRPDLGFPSALSCGTAYTGLALRALLNSSSKLSTDGRWIWSIMSFDKPGLDDPFNGAAAFDWLTTSTKIFFFCQWGRERKVTFLTHVSFRFRFRSVHCWGPATTSRVHLDFHLLPIHCHSCKVLFVALTSEAMSWKSAKLMSDECCCCKLHWAMSCSRKSNRSEEFSMKKLSQVFWPRQPSAHEDENKNRKTRGRWKKLKQSTWCEMSSCTQQWRRCRAALLLPSALASTWKCLAAKFPTVLTPSVERGAKHKHVKWQCDGFTAHRSTSWEEKQIPITFLVCVQMQNNFIKFPPDGDF